MGPRCLVQSHVSCISWWSRVDFFSTFVGKSPGLLQEKSWRSPGEVATSLPGHVFCNIGNFFDGGVRECVEQRVHVNTCDKDFLRPNFPHTPIESGYEMAKSGSASFLLKKYLFVFFLFTYNSRQKSLKFHCKLPTLN